MKQIPVVITILLASAAFGQVPQNVKPTMQEAPMKDAMKSDDQITKMIKADIAKDTSLSSDAKNVTVMTSSGMVTLSGTVKTAEEKASVESIAKRVAGDEKVKSEIEVGPAQ